MKHVEMHSEATEELYEAGKYLDAWQPGYGRALGVKIDSIISIIEEEPKSGSEYLASEFRFFKIRPFEYYLIYEEFAAVTLIVAVAHGKREPFYFRQRVRKWKQARATPKTNGRKRR